MEPVVDQLIRCIYASASDIAFSDAELAELLKIARIRNAGLGVTGMLLYVEGSFFQVIEGRAEIVDGLFARIEMDNRHKKVTLIIREPIPARDFADWTMGYADVSRTELSTIPGLNDFFLSGVSFNEMAPGRAKILLEAFRQGKWRRHLS